MTRLPFHLQERERAAIRDFPQRLSAFLGDDLRHLWLFGSKARGNFHEHSDVDLLIVLRGLDPERRGIIRRMAARVSLEYDILINTHLYEKDRWDAIVEHEDTLWREIQRDGISLRDLLTEPAP